MFERRLKFFLMFLLLASCGLVLRATQIQWVEHRYWIEQAQKSMKQSRLIESTRGSILDRKGMKLAFDAPCINASVDYRVITEEPDAKWLKDQADANLHQALGEDQVKKVKRAGQWAGLEAEEIAHVRSELDAMWVELAKIGNLSMDDITERRRSIVTEVETRRRYLWWRNYKISSMSTTRQSVPAWYQQFLSDSGDDNDVDKYEIDVGEQKAAHVILAAIDSEQQAKLAPLLDRFPALSLPPSKYREYPYGQIACHILGWMNKAGPEQLRLNDPNAGDELRQYTASDQTGRSGVEALCEQTLRGVKGRVEKDAAAGDVVSELDPVPGKDVRLSIDIDLEQEMQEAFALKRTHTDTTDHTVETRWDQHGGAVVIDIASGQILGMVSNPGFDPNTLGMMYSKMALNDIDAPLINRATQMALPPGSTVKPIVGSGAITHGFKTSTSTVECTGYLVLDNHRYPFGRCWVASMWAKSLTSVAHHPIPIGAEHKTGFLTITDGLERSCNVVFETIANDMGGKELNFWMGQFGLGRPTGVGIEEYRGRIPPPIDFPKNSPGRMDTCFAGIGQVGVEATPLQMANAAATIARRGIWIRPQLVAASDIGRATTKPAAPMGPDEVDLHLSPEAVDAVQLGMYRVCNTLAGTGRGILPVSQEPELANDPLANIQIAGKTGSAQTTLMTVPRRDPSGMQVLQDGRLVRDIVPIGAPGTEGWYQSVGEAKHMVHAWFIGYAPADHPQVAFCVMVQYGETGGRVAGAIAHDVLAACVRHGYLSANPVKNN